MVARQPPISTYCTSPISLSSACRRRSRGTGNRICPISSQLQKSSPSGFIIPKTREHAELVGRQSTRWHELIGADHDAVLIVTDHDGVDYDAIVQHAPLIVDTCNACRKIGIQSEKIALA